MRQIDSAKAIKELGVNYAPKSHSHSYLPLAGGTMTGPLKSSYSTNTYLNGNQGNALVSSMSSAGAYVAMLRYPSTSGYFTFVGYQGSMRLQYTNKATVDAGTNSVTSSITLMDEGGNASFPATLTANSINVKNSLLVKNSEVIHTGNMNVYDIYRVGAYNKACYNSDGDYRDYLYLGMTTDIGNYQPYLEWKGSWRQDPEEIKCKIFLEPGNRLSDGTNNFLKSNDYQVGMNGLVKDISGKDIRSITVSGRYRGSSCVNAPAGSTWYFYDIEVHNASYRKITARSLFNENEFVCTCNNGKWSSWIEIYTTANKPTPAEIGALPTNGGGIISGTVLPQLTIKNPNGEAAELLFDRDTNANWKFTTTGGNFRIQCDYTTGKVPLYDVMRLDYNTGATWFKGCGYSQKGEGSVYHFPNNIKLYIEWFEVAKNSSRKITLPSGLFKSRVLPPVLCGYVPAGNWETYSIANQVCINHWDLSSVTMANYDSSKNARVCLWVCGE